MRALVAGMTAVLVACAIGVASTQAATPKTGAWTITLDGAPTPPRVAKTGRLTVISKKGKLYVKSFDSPGFYVKCTGATARPGEREPGFPTQFGAPGSKVSKKGKFTAKGDFGSRVDSVKGTFTSKRRASGTMRVKIADKRNCDSTVSWKATK